MKEVAETYYVCDECGKKYVNKDGAIACEQRHMETRERNEKQNKLREDMDKAYDAYVKARKAFLEATCSKTSDPIEFFFGI